MVISKSISYNSYTWISYMSDSIAYLHIFFVYLISSLEMLGNFINYRNNLKVVTF